MSKFLKQREMWARFKKDTHGNFALIWGFGLTATLISVGAAVDLATAARVTTTAQAAADQVALSAAVFYSQYERLPENSSEGFLDGQVYRGDDAGYSFPSSVHGGNRRVKIRADYNEETGEVVVNVSGRVRTAFMGMLGSSYKTLKFSSEATANFRETEIKNPASITLVLDNSGSMSWDDEPAQCTSSWASSCSSPRGAEPRIDGLKDSTKNFMDLLDSYVGPQAVTGKRVLRTGMIPFDDSIINNRQVSMKWGTINDGQIRAMSPSGATNSSPPIARAWEWLQDEIAVHEAETNQDNPLRYMIFMTDGQNSGNRQWFAKAGTQLWLGEKCDRWNRCVYGLYSNPTRPGVIQGYSNWEEGEYISSADRESKNSCAAMKAQGVRVFTIGFALEPGTYMTNYGRNDAQTANIRTDTTTAAYAMLSDCASSAKDFVASANVSSLNAAFEVIGETIIQDVIRISN